MLVSLLYVSRAVGPQTTTVTSSILACSRSRNASEGVSGILCQGQGLYLQILEGERSSVNRLYAHILRDSRHVDADLLAYEEIDKRSYSQWSMAHVFLSSTDPMVTMNHKDFDPYAASGKMALQLLKDLVESGTPINTLVS